MSYTYICILYCIYNIISSHTYVYIYIYIYTYDRLHKIKDVIYNNQQPTHIVLSSIRLATFTCQRALRLRGHFLEMHAGFSNRLKSKILLEWMI